jgi:aldehyde:ferredoxin oxidoreductase
VFAYHGRYLWLDVTTGRQECLPLPEAEARAYLGGAGLATRWLYRHAPAGVDPFAPENPLVLASCPMVDTGLTTTSKATFAARSPQTGFLGESLISSHFAIALKRTGWDGLVVQGACDTLSALVIDEDSVNLLPVPELAGKSGSETEAALRASLGRDFQVAAIGPAGEHRVRYATISHDGRHAGRTGLGAVMGAKGLKAIALRGDRRTALSDSVGLREAARALQARSRGPETAKYRLLGTAGNMLTFDRLGVLPSRNFQESQFAGAERLTGERLAEGHRRERTGCAACTVGCEHRFIPAGATGSVRAEYESLFALGPLLGVDDPDAVLRAAELCDELGMDTLSFGGTVAWAMEAAERGLLDPEGVDLRFGSVDAVAELAGRVARRDGKLAALLAEGSRRAAERVGRGSEAWAMHVKGLELPGYEPRALKTLALGLAVGARGACHNRSSAYEADFTSGPARLDADVPRGAAAAAAEDRAAVLDSLVICKFLRGCFDDFYADAAHLLRLLTGWDVSAAELRQAGARIVTLKRAYNQREGASRADDTLPPRLLDEAIPAGPGAGARICREDLERMLDDYYAVRGWNPDGTVPSALVEEALDPTAEDPRRGWSAGGTHP